MAGESFWSRLARFLSVVFLAAAFSALAAPASAERRAAIVVGNGGYEFAPLANPHNDAKLIAEALTELEFDVLLFYDLKKEAVKDLQDAVRAHLIGADMAVLYYAGHALQNKGQNLLLPVDVRTGSANEVIEDALRLNDLLEIVKDDPVGMKLFILDACRNNPITREKGLEQGLAHTEAGTGQVLIAFATSAGEVAYDGTGANSPYSAALANALQQPGLDVYGTFRTVRGDVRLATGGSQIPWITGSIETEFVFRQSGREPEAGIAAAPDGGLKIDEVLWFFIRESANPDDFVRFAEVFPSSRHAEEARERSQVQIAALAERGLYINGALVSAPISASASVDASTEAASAEFIFEQAGERAVSETFRIWPRELPETARGMKSIVTECDLYAADPNDPQRAVPGVTNGLVNVRDALRACAFALAADTGNPRLQFQLGRVLEISGRYDWAEHYYSLAGNQQYSAALVNLGYMYRVGMGRAVDEARMLDYYLQAAEMGNLRARTNVGTAFIRGQGVPPLPEEGILWYRLAASSGWTNAITALGDSFRRGVGVKQDHVEAARLYAAAADAGQIDAMSNLGRAYLAGQGVEKDIERGLDLLLKATEMGNQYAPFFAGQVFLRGEKGVKRDSARALSLYELAARRGFEGAYLGLASGYLDGSLSGGKPDLRRAYFNALLATQFKADDAEKVRDEIAAKLDENAKGLVESEAELFIQQNGK